VSGDPPPGSRRLLLSAIRRGFVALLLTAAAAEAAAFAVDLAAGHPFRAWSFVKIGWLYVLSFSRVGLEVRLSSAVSAVAGSGVGGFLYRMHVAFLSGTALAVWLLFLAGRRAAERAPTAVGRRALVGAFVAPGYAVPSFALALAATIRLPEFALESIRPVPWEALALPFAMAAAAGAVGGLAASRAAVEARPPWGPRAVAWATGGWRMLMASIGFAFVGLLLLAAVHPADVGTYVRWHERTGRTGGIALAHEVLALPNIGEWLVAPSMGGCDVASSSGGTTRLVCSDGVIDPAGLATLRVRRIPLPWGSFVFLGVPLAATLLGGERAARGVRARRERLLRGGGAGVVFGVLTGAAARVAGLAISSSGDPGSAIRLGPRPLSTAALGLVWGVVGGAAGTLLPVAQEDGGDPEGAPVDPEAPVPPRPTSV
jgi:hypothetical protein